MDERDLSQLFSGGLDDPASLPPDAPAEVAEALDFARRLESALPDPRPVPREALRARLIEHHPGQARLGRLRAGLELAGRAIAAVALFAALLVLFDRLLPGGPLLPGTQITPTAQISGTPLPLENPDARAELERLSASLPYTLLVLDPDRLPFSLSLQWVTEEKKSLFIDVIQVYASPYGELILSQTAPDDEAPLKATGEAQVRGTTGYWATLNTGQRLLTWQESGAQVTLRGFVDDDTLLAAAESLTAFTPPDEAWNEYVEPGPGFAFQYPPGWELAVQEGPRIITLTSPDGAVLSIACQPMAMSYSPAPDLGEQKQAAGQVEFIDELVTRWLFGPPGEDRFTAAAYYEDRAPAARGTLSFWIWLESSTAADLESGLSAETLRQADRIVSSFRLIEPSPSATETPADFSAAPGLLEWSPDGQYLLYLDAAGLPRIWSAETGPVDLLPGLEKGAVAAFDAAWTSGGELLAAIQYARHPDNQAGVYRIPLEPGLPLPRTVTQALFIGAPGATPGWIQFEASPDGTQMAAAYGGQLWRYDPESDSFLPSNLPGEYDQVAGLRFSPDGSRLALQLTGSACASPCAALALMELPGGETRLLREGLSLLDWSPDGRWLAGLSLSDGSRDQTVDAYRIDPDTGEALNLTRTNPSGFDPLLDDPAAGQPAPVQVLRFAWSPDGSYLAELRDYSLLPESYNYLAGHRFAAWDPSGQPLALPAPERDAWQLWPRWIQGGRLMYAEARYTGGMPERYQIERIRIDGQPLEVDLPADPVLRLSFSPDGRCAAAVTVPPEGDWQRGARLEIIPLAP